MMQEVSKAVAAVLERVATEKSTTVNEVISLHQSLRSLLKQRGLIFAQNMVLKNTYF
jgi:hypothetical protein